MTKLVDRVAPESNPKQKAQPQPQPRAQHQQDSPSPSTEGEESATYRRLDALEASIAQESPVGLLLGLRQAATPQRPLSIPTPESPSAAAHTTPASLTGSTTTSALDSTRRALYALFPSQSDINAVTQSSAAAYFVISLFCSFRDIIEGRAQSADVVSTIPPPDSHPAVLAKRLLQIIICMQQTPPGFDLQMLHMKTSTPEVMANIISVVSRLVTSDDEYVSTSEGLECLVLQGFWHANAGNLRKAWLSYRKALSLAQLMGLDRNCSRTLKSVDPAIPVRQRTTPYGLWYRINICDRFYSLLLGLPVGNTDSSYASSESMKRDTEMERMEKVQSVIAARIVARNANKTAEAYAMTQAIDLELKQLAETMDDEWWTEPVLDPFEGKEHNLGLMFRLFRQTQQHDLIIMLHLPYMLRDPVLYPDSRARCIHSSREVLKRFVSFRTLYNSAWSCRHIDYSALIAAMTLLLSYLRHGHDASYVPSFADIISDRQLVEVVRERMQHISVVNRDKLSQESADIVGQMMSILDSVDSSSMTSGFSESGANALRCLHFNIPYFGTVDIHPALTSAVKNVAGGSGQAGRAVYSPLSEEAAPTNLQGLQPAMASLSTAIAPSTLEEDVMQMDFGAMDPSLLPADASFNGMFMQFDAQPQDGVLELPLTAEADDWIFQGVDTTYWSLLNENIVFPPS